MADERTMTEKAGVPRRGFFAGALACVAALPQMGAAAEKGAPAPGRFPEPPRDLPMAEDCDLIVAGGGPAGIAAAVTAARAGKRMRLFEAHGALGGVWTSGLLSCILDFGRAGIARELIARLDARGARHPRLARMLDSTFIYDPESMKLVLEEMVSEAGVRFTYHSPVVAAYRDASGRCIDVVVTESKSGRRAWRAPLFIDCTGDGDLAALAGCGFDVGDGQGGADQPASLIALVTADDDAALGRFAVNDPSAFGADGASAANRKKALYDELVRLGHEPSYAAPTLFRIRPGLFALMANHEYGVRVDDAEGITAATVRARREVAAMVDALARKGGAAWRGLRIVVTAEQLGHRGARRIHGRYTLTSADLAAGRQFPDAVADCAFCIDVHGTSLAHNRTQPNGFQGSLVAQPYQIPLRACRAKDVDNLYMAGRCISGDFLAQASYRVTGPAVAMGEGVARAILHRPALLPVFVAAPSDAKPRPLSE